MRKIKGKNILVTGGAGFIGSHLVDELVKNEPAKVIVVDNFFLGKKENLLDAGKFPGFKIYNQDATVYEAMEDIVNSEKIDVVFNLATKALPYSFVNPDDAYKVNVDIASVLLRLLHKNAYQALVHYSSSEAYGTAQYVPIDEKHPLRPETLYAAGKASADLMVIAYIQTYGLNVVTVRPFNNYGPRQNEGMYAGVIPITIKRIFNGEKPVLEGDGKQTRDFIYVGDTVRATIDIYENEKTVGQIINVATGKETTIKEIIGTICDLMDYKGKWDVRPTRAGDVRRHLGDISLAKKMIGFGPKVSLEEGLKPTVEWYVNRLSINGKNKTGKSKS
jgi:UDP-glucose 4-epimerase